MRAPNHLNALRAFESAARHLSYVGAAQELNVTPAAVCQLVRRLEEAHGVPTVVAQIDAHDPWSRALNPVVTAWTEAVIWMGMRS
ncbi:MAG: HTH-type transcriptional activator AmpR [Pseudomonas sp.]|nr:MAG: HTH-type transcriptional activator AmpR [Pseudomonas sp.]